MVKKMILEGVNGYEVGGRLEVGREGVLGLFFLSVIEIRDRRVGSLGVFGIFFVVKVGVLVRSLVGKRCYI